MKLFLTISLAVFLRCFGSIAVYDKLERDRVAAEKAEQESRAHDGRPQRSVSRTLSTESGARMIESIAY
jgi:hypothetical protein